jgi:hypothetical protein
MTSIDVCRGLNERLLSARAGIFQEKALARTKKNGFLDSAALRSE